MRVSVVYNGDTVTGTRLADGTVIVDPWVHLWGGMELSPDDYGRRVILPDQQPWETLPQGKLKSGEAYRQSRLAKRNPKNSR